MEEPATVMGWALKVLATADPELKAVHTRTAVEKWRTVPFQQSPKNQIFLLEMNVQ